MGIAIMPSRGAGGVTGDGALFVGFQHRFAKSLKFKNHIVQPDGLFRTVEVKDAAGERIPMVTQSTLDLYRDRFRELDVRDPAIRFMVKAARDERSVLPNTLELITVDISHALLNLSILEADRGFAVGQNKCEADQGSPAVRHADKHRASP
ncbi:hypothetical protein AK812_SmicGene13416 [Symbiodinium microadriaticum]|uniref:Uncharacterized protein n=1 Tax=Symbiodinium microadriaticum TaxID=2951 RepID=A0A1Q9E868_SYMMI|nr:hypothetical protein AK812_SmicGene13416 [Symbiodinium microadriaticum]CAE7340229.1 unnamed protein product [Symbiodinium microadriaticum]